jgi:hypothetical protein
MYISVYCQLIGISESIEDMIIPFYQVIPRQGERVIIDCKPYLVDSVTHTFTTNQHSSHAVVMKLLEEVS